MEAAAPSRRQIEPYCDRIRPPAETVARMRPHFEGLGITRVARQTGLDRIGIPCFAAFRPNALTLSNSQGKGIDDDSAMASAVMEAVEFAIAERPVPIAEVGSIASLGPGAVYTAPRSMPIGRPIPTDLELTLVAGHEIVADEPILVPSDLVSLDLRETRVSLIARSTNGLASGNSFEEALLHGLLELIERDATTLAGFRPVAVIDPLSLMDDVVADLVDRIRDARLELWLFDQTSDLGIPTYKALIGDPAFGYTRYLDLSAGFGCHPVAARAAIRAITEAAQTRVTNVAGSRDDFLPEEYRRHADTARRTVLGTPFAGMRARPEGLVVGTSPTDLLPFVLAQLHARGVSQVTCIELPTDGLGISVVKVLAPDLEDRSCNRHWRPGRRSLNAMLEAA